MSLFVCDNCGCIDNTACGGTFTTRNMDIWNEEDRGKALCVECSPTKFVDGSRNPDAGKWHNKFDKIKYTEEYRDEVLNPPQKL